MASPTTSKLAGVEYIQIAKIKISDRLRRDDNETQRHVDELAASIKNVGLIVPITLDDDNNLLAGWCRTQAHLKLGKKTIPYVTRGNLTAADAVAIEVEENFRRKSMRWQEVAMGIYRAHSYARAEASARMEKWTATATGKLLGTSISHTANCLVFAKFLIAGDPEICAASTIREAESIILKRKQDEVAVALARKSAATNVIIADPQTLQPPKAAKFETIELGIVTRPESTPAEPKSGYLVRPAQIIDLRPMAYLADNREWFASRPANTVDAIYTDIPYGIDMADLEGIEGVDSVADEHEVEENLSQMPGFLKNSYRVLKPDGWCCFFFALEHFEKLRDWGEAVGFKVQPWPVLWVKPHSTKNSAPQARFAKNYEPCMIMRKGRATLLEVRPKSTLECDATSDKRSQAHPFLKPFEFNKWLLQAIISPGKVLLDPYAGHGSIVRSAIALGIQPIAVEKMPKHFPHLVSKMQETYRNMLGPETTFINPEGI